MLSETMMGWKENTCMGVDMEGKMGELGWNCLKYLDYKGSRKESNGHSWGLCYLELHHFSCKQIFWASIKISLVADCNSSDHDAPLN